MLIIITRASMRSLTRGIPPLQPSTCATKKSNDWLYLDAEVLVLPPVFLSQDCFCWALTTVVIQRPPARFPVSSVCVGVACWCGLSRAGFLSFPAPFSLRVSISRSTGILGIPLPVLLSNMLLTDKRNFCTEATAAHGLT